jgi:hypothetical protein
MDPITNCSSRRRDDKNMDGVLQIFLPRGNAPILCGGEGAELLTSGHVRWSAAAPVVVGEAIRRMGQHM